MSVLNQVKNLLFSVEEKNTSAIVVADKVVLNLPSGNKIVTMRGERLEAPFWIISILESRGLIKQEEPMLTINDILKVHHDETHKKSSRELSTLPDNFYFRTRKFFEDLEKKISEKPTPEAINQLNQAERLVNEIIEKRLITILYIAISGRGEEQILGKMSPEEEALYRWVRLTINSWREILLGRRIG
jgi:hypothetical protein